MGCSRDLSRLALAGQRFVRFALSLPAGAAEIPIGHLADQSGATSDVGVPYAQGPLLVLGHGARDLIAVIDRLDVHLLAADAALAVRYATLASISALALALSLPAGAAEIPIGHLADQSARRSTRGWRSGSSFLLGVARPSSAV
jgi:hypothetical protein